MNSFGTATARRGKEGELLMVKNELSQKKNLNMNPYPQAKGSIKFYFENLDSRVGLRALPFV